MKLINEITTTVTHARLASSARMRRYTEVVLPLNAQVYVLCAVEKKTGCRPFIVSNWAEENVRALGTALSGLGLALLISRFS